MPELSLVIPSHNRPELLRACLTSLAQHAPKGTEVVVVDDGSPDQAVSRVVALFSLVSCVRLPRRRGFCVAANIGIATCRGGVVELLNDDTEVTAGWEAAALVHFANPQVVAVAPLVLYQSSSNREPTRIDSAGDSYYRGGVARKRHHGVPLGAFPLQPGRVFGASASSAFYRREAVLRVGAFPEGFGAYFEDVDLSFRLKRGGGEIIFEPASRVWHRISASYGPPRRRLLEQQSRNEELVFWRNLPAGELVRAFPCHLAVLAGKAWRRWQEGQLLPFLIGRLGSLVALPQVICHRRQLPQVGPDAPIQQWGVERGVPHNLSTAGQKQFLTLPL